MKPALVPFLLSALVVPVASAAPAPPGGASRTYAIPHVLESPGAIDVTARTHDAYIVVVDGRGLPAGDRGGARKQGDADVRVYLYEDDGKPVTSATGASVCNPCTYALDPQGHRRHTISIEDAVLAAGGFALNPGLPPGEPVIDCFAVVVVSGADPDGIVVDIRNEASGDTPHGSRRCPECFKGHVTLIR